MSETTNGKNGYASRWQLWATIVGTVLALFSLFLAQEDRFVHTALYNRDRAEDQVRYRADQLRIEATLDRIEEKLDKLGAR